MVRTGSERFGPVRPTFVLVRFKVRRGVKVPPLVQNFLKSMSIDAPGRWQHVGTFKIFCRAKNIFFDFFCPQQKSSFSEKFAKIRKTG